MDIFKKFLYVYLDQRARIHRLSREGGWIIAGQVASVLGSLVLVRVLTEHLEPAEYGQLALALTLVTLINQVVMGGLVAGIGRFYSIATKNDDRLEYLRASRRALITATMVILGTGIVIMSTLAALDLRNWLSLIITALTLSILSGYNSALNGIQNAARQRAIVAMHGGMDAWLKIGLTVGVMLWLGASSTSVMAGYSLAAFFVTISQLFFLRRVIAMQAVKSAPKASEDWIRRMWLFAWPITVGGLFNWGYYASQRWALELFVSTNEVGTFYALTQVAYNPIALAGALFISFITPIVYGRVDDPNNRASIEHVRLLLFKIAATGLTGTLILTATAYFFHEWIFTLLVAEEYRAFSIFMPLVVLAAGLLQVSHSLSILISAQNRTHLFIWSDIVGNSIAAIVNLLLTSMYGVSGLLAGMALGSLIHLTWKMQIVNSASRYHRMI